MSASAVVAQILKTPCYLPIGVSAARLFCRSRLSGAKAMSWRSIWHQISICFKSCAKPANQVQNRRSIMCSPPTCPKKSPPISAKKSDMAGNMADFSNKRLTDLSEQLHNWRIKPTGSEGYRTAEVTLGGVDTSHLSSKTMMANKVNGLYFIGEVVDVTGWLGGYNFQWAWSSGWCAGQVV